VKRLFGYHGKIGWIDLTGGIVEDRTLEESIARKYLGGKGLGAYLLYKHLKPQTDPLGPGNIIIFVTGPLTGTNFPAVSRSGVITKSPLTGTFLDSYSGGFFGTQLKWAGYDALVISGRAETPVYLLVDDGKITIMPADHIWGLTTSETEKRLKKELAKKRNQKMSVAAIGPAGENLVRFACIINEKRAHGRGGPGAVMGSKNLKAVVVKGGRKPEKADDAQYKKVLRRSIDNIARNPAVGKEGVFPKYGTMATISLTNETGTLPSRNWQENSYEPTEKIDGDAFRRFQIRSRSCFLCPIGCSRETAGTINDRRYVTEGPDYETMFAFGPNCSIDDTEVIIAADHLCDNLGMDTISCGGVIGFAMECVDRGLLSGKELGNLDLSFGNGNAMIQAIPLIARKEGVGRLLAKGVKRLSEEIKGSSDFAIHVKGLELPGYDPRGMKGQGLSYAVSDRGGCHVRANTLRTELMGLGLDKPMDRYAYAEKAAMVRTLQLSYAACDCMIACMFGSTAIKMEDYAEAITAVSGWPFTEKELLTVAERAWNLTRLFNLREGFSRQDDTLPERLFKEPSSRGPSRGQIVDRKEFEKMLSQYYEIVGWDPRTGIPTEDKLRALGIEKV